MGRHASPRWYESRKAWYVEIGGKQHMLAKGKANKAEAFAAFHRLMAEGASPARRAELSVQLMIDLFLRASDGKVTPETHAGYTRRLQAFIDACGAGKASEIRPFHVERWLDQHPGWNDSTRFGYVAAIKRAFRWATRQGHLDRDPVEHLDRPTMGRRTAVLSPEQYAAVLARADVPRLRPFRDLIVGLWETGCRPSELATLTADRVDLAQGVWVVINKTRHRTGKPTRMVGLTPTALEMSGRLLAKHPEGLVFRNFRGNAWTRHAMACNFADIRKALGFGPEVTAYAFRHRYATDGMVNGRGVGDVATAMGHADTKMVMGVYSHAGNDPEHLRAIARAIRPDASPAAGHTGGGPAPPPARATPPAPGTTPDTPPDPPA